MSTIIGIVLFVVGVGALVASVLMDRRAPVVARRSGGARVERPSPAQERPVAAPVIEIEEPAEPEPAEPEPAEPPALDVPAPREVPSQGPSGAVVAAPASSADRLATAEARLAELRAELSGGRSTPPSTETRSAAPPAESGPSAPTAPMEPSSAPEAGSEPAPAPSRAADAGRVFAAVASVGRDPTVVPEVMPAEPAPVEPEPSAVAEAPSTPVTSATSPEAADEPGPSSTTAPPAAPTAEAEAAASQGHTHALPIVNHSDLITHLRREHPDLGSGGSTIQMRVVHERSHAVER